VSFVFVFADREPFLLHSDLQKAVAVHGHAISLHPKLFHSFIPLITATVTSKSANVADLDHKMKKYEYKINYCKITKLFHYFVPLITATVTSANLVSMDC
jgi:hypothetical protein